MPHTKTPMPCPQAVLGGPHLHPTTNDCQLLFLLSLWYSHLFIRLNYDKIWPRI